MKSKFKYLFIGLTALFSVGLLSFEKPVNDFFEIAKNLEIFNSVYRELNIYYVDETQPGELMTTGMKAMLKSLDPYTIYYPESRIEEARFANTGRYGGIGIKTITQEGKYFVSEIFEGLPGADGGLLPGDQIISIDGNIVDGLRDDEMALLMKGPTGSQLEMVVKRYGESSKLNFSIERKEIEIPPVPFYGMIDDKMGYVKLTSFTRTASMEVRAAIKEMMDNSMEELILDLRGNGGGLLREAVNIVNLFVPKNTIVVQTKGKIESWNKTHSTLTDPLAPDIPLVVLIDEGSASASEIVSGTLQDLDRAVVIGTKSFGKGLVQQTKDIAFNSKLKLTVAKYYTPSGRCIQKLDYSNKIDGIAKEVDRDNINTFYTENGRPVTDGEGITPDVDIYIKEAKYMMNGLNAAHTIFHYATKYFHEHDSISSPNDFRIADKEYEDFVNFAIEQQLDYTSETEIQFERLLQVSENENLYSGLEEDFVSLSEKIKPDVKSDLSKFKSMVKGKVESEIASRYYYQDGRVKNELQIDPGILKSREVFDTNYESILSGKN